MGDWLDGPCITVNGRFLGARPTGLHRVGRGLLQAARRRGLPLEVLAPAGTRDQLVDRLTPALPSRVGAHLWEQVSLPALAGRRPVLSLTNTGPLAARVGVVMLADLSPLVEPSWYRAAGRAYMRLAVAAARRARLVLVMCEQVGREVVDAGIAGRGRVRVVRPAVDDRFRPAPAESVQRVRRHYGLEEPFLLHVGSGDPRKDAATAVAAHLRLVTSLPHRLVLVGGTHRNLASPAHHDAPTVVWAGHVDDDELVALLTGAAALVYPTRYEGFGLPPLEAQACGTPAICSDIPVLHENTEGRARFVQPGDVGAWAAAMQEALRGTLAPQEPPRWTWDDAAAQLEDALADAGCL